jgi:hypothetical protein
VTVEAEKRWLVTAFRADMDVLRVELVHGPLDVPVLPGDSNAMRACRCYRCGALLTVEAVQVDRFGSLGVRPACEGCVWDEG